MWSQACGDDSKWQAGRGGFGTFVPGGHVKTVWRSERIWLRRTFDLPADAKLKAPALLAHHDDDMEVYLNGVLAAKAEGFTTRYEVFPIAREAEATLKPGSNLLAVRAWFKGGGQYIDVGLVDTLSAAEPVEKPAPGVTPAFSLKGTQVLDHGACRKWSDAYKALADRRFCNWINIQSEPSMLPPYHAGAAKSKLIALLEGGHYGVKLSADELDRFATWIDLLVPFCGDYTEAMNEPNIPRYLHFLTKRKRMEVLEAQNIADLLASLREER
jgi:hypothetical protein